jgi:hypothetical protein
MHVDLPTARWREDMADGDDNFTEEGIVAVEDEKVLEAMKAAVLSLNEIGGLDGRFESLVETSEREELCEYLFAVARNSGLVLAPGEDPTYEWRDW